MAGEPSTLHTIGVICQSRQAKQTGKADNATIVVKTVSKGLPDDIVRSNRAQWYMRFLGEGPRGWGQEAWGGRVMR